MVHRTHEGIYGQFEVNRGLPASYLVKYFVRAGTDWQLRPAVRRLVQAREMNLAEPWPPLARFDVIMLRNVLMYFDLETKRAILRRARQVLRPDGVLFLGSAETTGTVDDAWERLISGASMSYRPTPAAANAMAVPA
jgi:chemotaxis protein methyltransferase CheR